MASRRSGSEFRIDLSVLVDIISNAAGMMILFACLAMITNDQKSTAPQLDAKPIDFPLAYLPYDKRTVTLVLKNDELYLLPAEALLKEVLDQNRKGVFIDAVQVEKNGVVGRALFTPSGLGYRFMYKMNQGDGIPLHKAIQLKKTLDELLDKYPKDRYFTTIYAWPDEFDELREIREYLIQHGMVVGWNPRLDPPGMRGTWDVIMAYGEYSEGFSTIKAQ